MTPVVHHVEVEHHLDVAVPLDFGDRLTHGHVFVQREDMRIHDAAGSSFVVLEQVLDDPGFFRAHQVEHGRGQFLRQVIDQCGSIVGRNFLCEPRNLFGGTGRQQRRAGFRAQLGDGLHGQPAVALGQQAERRIALLVLQFAEHLREVGGMLFLQEIQQVRGRANAQQPPHRVENDVDSSLRRHRQLQEGAAQNRRGNREIDDQTGDVHERRDQRRR